MKYKITLHSCGFLDLRDMVLSAVSVPYLRCEGDKTSFQLDWKAKRDKRHFASKSAMLRHIFKGRFA